MRVRKDALAILNAADSLNRVCPYCMAGEENIRPPSLGDILLPTEGGFVGGVRLICDACLACYVVGYAHNPRHALPHGTGLMVIIR